MTQAGYARRFDSPRTLEEFNIFQGIKRNAAIFSAYKNQAVNAELYRELVDARGQKVALQAFLDKAAGVLKRHHKDYLQAELVTSMSAAQTAAKWQNIEARKHIYPNLKYQTANDERVRQSHKILDGAIYPVDDPFWDTHYPPNGWRCRCDVVQTDETTTPAAAGLDIPKGFKNNPGKTYKLFADDHPYYNVSPLNKDKIDRQAKLFRAAYERKHLLELTADRFLDKTFTVSDLPGQLSISKRSIREVQAHYHEAPDIKNSIPTILDILMPQLKLVKESVNDDPIKTGTTRFFYYLVELSGVKYYLNIREVKVGEEIRYMLYAISDKI